LRALAGALHRALYLYRWALGVLVTDLFQFILKMSMIIVLAWVAVSKMGGMTLLKLQLSHVDEAVRQTGQSTGSVTAFFPSFQMGWTTVRDLDAAGDHLRALSGSAMVGELVSGRGAGRRRVRRAANVQREGREEFARGDVVVQTSRTTR